MAIYHFSAKVISRSTGSSAVASAAYRSASRLHDERIDRHPDFTNKAGVVHSEVMLPEGADPQLGDRATLWNAVEAAEKRIDAQLAREIEFAIPRELDRAESIRLARDFVRTEFVARGMVADLNVHWDIGSDGQPKPHAHVMLSTRSVDGEGFGPKVRDWNCTDLLDHWRERWGSHVNARLAELDIDARVDHRSLEAQGIDLEPQPKIGPAAARMAGQGLASERLDDFEAVARANGEKLIANPSLALDAITRSQATFTPRDAAMFVHRHSADRDQYNRVMAALRTSPDLVVLGKDGRGDIRMTSRAMIETEQRLAHASARLVAQRQHGLATAAQRTKEAAAGSHGLLLGKEQQTALRTVLRNDGLAIVTGYAGTGKSAMLGVAREAWEAAGYRVSGAALSGIAAEGLEHGSGIASSTLARLEHRWAQDRDLLGTRDVLVVDEAGMIGTRQMERVMSEVAKRGAKLVLVGDPEQLQAIEAGAAFRSLAERHGSVEITQVRRQHDDWQQLATRQLATGRTSEALDTYQAKGAVHATETRDAARAGLIDRWDRERQATPDATRIILTHTNDEVQALNEAARDRLRISGALGSDVAVATERGSRTFAAGDRIMFLKNERSLGVKNGTLGTVDRLSTARMAVLLDNGSAVAFDVKDYAAIDHGYAATIHKAQGMTVDRAHVLATPGLDRHAAYVALSRHRDRVDLHYGRDDFVDQGSLVRTLSRERAKDMASDYVQAFGNARGIDVLTPDSPLLQPPPRAPARTSEPQADVSAMAVRHAKIVARIQYDASVGDQPTPAQTAELKSSRAALRTLYTQAPDDLENAFANNSSLLDDAAKGRTAATIRAMQLEAEMRGNPQLRADTFVTRWQGLDRQRRALVRGYETGRADKVARTMVGMAKRLERDPQVESILRNRKADLGLPAVGSRGVGQTLAEMVGRGLGKGLGIGM